MVRVWRCRHQSRSGFFREFRVACRATFARCARLAPQSQRGDPGRPANRGAHAAILYQTLAKAPLLGDAERALSTRHFLRELNRFGVTSAIDPSGGFQSLAILSADYFTVPDGKIADIEPLCMVAGGRGGLRRGGSSKGWTSRSRTLRRAGALSPGTAASAQAHGPGWPWLASWPSWPLPRLISGQIDR